MRKVLLSLVVLAASGGYAWSQYGKILAQDAAIDGADLGTAASSQQALSAPSTLPVKSAPLETSSVVEPPPASKASAVTVTGALSRGVDHTVTGSTVAALIAHAAFAPMPPARAPTPTPTPQPQIAALPPKLPVPPQEKYRDGTYRGATANAYYGLVQVQAIIKGGSLVSVKVLQYPSDRNTSRYINAHALPVLQREAIKAQTAKVDFVSGATLTSQAYIKSLSSALTQGHSPQAGL